MKTIHGYTMASIRRMIDVMQIDDVADKIGVDPEKMAAIIGTPAQKRFRLIDKKTGRFWDYASWRRAYRQSMLLGLTEYSFEFM